MQLRAQETVQVLEVKNWNWQQAWSEFLISVVWV